MVCWLFRQHSVVFRSSTKALPLARCSRYVGKGNCMFADSITRKMRGFVSSLSPLLRPTSITRRMRWFAFFLCSAFLFQSPKSSAEPNLLRGWPAGLSDFCLDYLKGCHRRCFKQKQHVRDPNGKLYPPFVVGFLCRRICWNTPQRQQICQMSEAQFRSFARKFEHEEREKLKKEALEQEQNRQEETNRQQAEKRRLQRLQEQRQEEEERLQAQRQQLEEQKRKIQAQQKAEEQARNAIKTKAQAEAKAQQIEIDRMRKALAEQRKAMELQRQMVEEEQKRLAVIKKKAEERKRLEEERQQIEAKRLAEWERLRLEREKQLEALRKQSDEEQKRITEMRKHTEREKQLAEERNRLAAEQAAAEQQKEADRLAAVRRANKELKRKMARLKLRKQRLQKQRELARQNQKARIERMKRLALASNKQRTRKIKRPKVSPGLRLFRNGQLNEAVAEFEKEGSTEKAEQIKEFQQYYRRGTEAYQRRNANEGIPALERAFTLDYDLSEGSSNYTPLLRRMLSRMHTMRGMLSMSQNEYPAAFNAFSSAHKHDKKNDTALQQLAKIREVANQRYQQGIQLKSSNPQASRHLMLQVCRLVRPSDPLCKQTKKELNEL